MPVIDCHEHTLGPAGAPKYKEPVASLIGGYVQSDLMSAGGEADLAMLCDPAVATETKWPVFERLWRRTEHTGYARTVKWVLKNHYGLEEVTLKELKGIAGRLIDLSDPKRYKAYLDKQGIRCRLVDLPVWATRACPQRCCRASTGCRRTTVC